jgi:hypothetical protein
LKVIEMKRNQSRSGQAVVVAAFSLSLMLGAMSLVVDLGWGYYRREAGQSAADAAAAAAIRAVETSGGTPSCGTGIVWCGTPAGTITNCPSTAPTTATNSFDNACMLAAANGFTTTGSKVVSVQANTTSPPPTVPGATVSYWVTVRISESTSAFFSNVGAAWHASHAYALGAEILANGYIQQVTAAGTSGSSAPSFPTVTGQTTTDNTVTWTTLGANGTAFNSNVMATAGITTSGTSTAAPCIYVLSPNAPAAFDAGNGVNVTTASCGIYVNSTSSTALTVVGGSKVTAPTIDVVGGTSINNGGSTTTTPLTGVSAVGDPFASLPVPTAPANSTSTSCANYSGNYSAWVSGGYSLCPGTYSSGLALSNGNPAVMASGIYVISGGPFSIQSGPLTASGPVLIYLSGSSAYVNIANGTTVTLSAMTSGTYQGVLFYQDRTVTSPAASTFAGGANMTLTGSIYLPNALLNINNGSSTSTEALVVGTVNFEGGATFSEGTQAQTGLSASVTSTASVLQ